MSTCMMCQLPCISGRRPKKDELFGAPCDCCHLFVCRTCAGITATEVDTLALSQRFCIFYCFNCKGKLKNLTKLEEITEELNKTKLECKEKVNAAENMKQKYKNKITGLSDELEKLRAIVKRQSADKGDSARTCDQKCRDNLDKLNNKIAELDNEVESLKKDNEELAQCMKNTEEERADLVKMQRLNAELSQKLVTAEEEFNKQGAYLEEMKNTNRDMVNAIRLLENDNEAFRQQSTQQKREASSYSEITTDYREDGKRQSIIIYGDDLANNLRNVLDGCLHKKFKITATIKVNAPLEEIVRDIDETTTQLTKKDYVIVMGGLVNILNGLQVKDDVIQNFRKVNERTNLIVFSVPLWNENQILNNFINNHNKYLCNRIYESNICKFFMHFNAIVHSKKFYFNDNIHINFRGKVMVAKAIRTLIMGNRAQTTENSVNDKISVRNNFLEKSK